MATPCWDLAPLTAGPTHIIESTDHHEAAAARVWWGARVFISSPLQIIAVGLDSAWAPLQYSNASELSLVGFTCRHMFMFFCTLFTHRPWGERRRQRCRAWPWMRPIQWRMYDCSGSTFCRQSWPVIEDCYHSRVATQKFCYTAMAVN